MKTLEEEANEWIENTSQHLSVKNGFIAGATSKYVEREKLKFTIEILKKIEDYFDNFSIYHVCDEEIIELKNQLKEL